MFGLALAILLPAALAQAPPVVTLDAPVDYYNTSNNATDFSFIAVSETDLTGINCTLYLNDTYPYGENASVLNATLTAITADPEIPDGIYNWYVNCTDSNGEAQSDETRTITIDTIPPEMLLGSNLFNDSGPYTYDSGLFIGGAVVEFDGYVNDTEGGSGLLNWSIILYNQADGSFNSTICENTSGTIPINGTLCTWDTESICPAENECGNFTVNLTVYDNAGNPSDIIENSMIFPVYIDNIYPEIENALFSFNYGEDGNFWTAEFETSDNYLTRVRGYTLNSDDYVVIGRGFLCNETQGNECNGPGSGTFEYEWYLDTYTLNDTAVPDYLKFNFGLNSNDWYLATVPGCIKFNESVGYDCGQDYDVCIGPDNCVKKYRWWLVYNMSLENNTIGPLIGVTQENYCPEEGTCLIDDTSIESGVTNFTLQRDHYDGEGSWTIENTTEITLYDVGDPLNVNLTHAEPNGTYNFLVQSDDYFWTSDSEWLDAFNADVCGENIGDCQCGDTIYTNYTFGGGLDCSVEGMDAFNIGADNITIDCAGNSIIGNDSANYAGFVATTASGVTIKNCNLSSFGAGIVAAFSNNSNFLGNIIDLGDNGSTGIAELACNGNTIENNTIIDNSLANTNLGIFLAGLGFASDHHVINNTIIQNCGSTCMGIVTEAEDHSVIQNNNITSNYLGILLDNSNDISIISNNISITGLFGGGSLSLPISLSIAGIKNKYKISNENISINNISINDGFPLITGIMLEATEPELGGDNVINGNTLTGDVFTGILSTTERNILTNNVIDGVGSAFNGIYLTGTQFGEEDPVTAEDNYLSGNEIFNSVFGVYADGSTYSLNNFTINGDNYHDSMMAGLYLDTVGTEEIMPTIANSNMHDNCQGTYLEASFANIEDTYYINNNNLICPPGFQLGLSVDGTSTAYITDGDFTANGYDTSYYGIQDVAPDSVYWTIAGNATCRDNNITIVTGGIEFDGGTLEIDNCSISTPNMAAPLAFNANLTSLDVFPNELINANESTEFDFALSVPPTNLALYVNDPIIAAVLAVGGQTPASAPSGYTIITGINIETDDTTNAELTWALIKIYYNQTEVSAAGIDENSLAIYFYNETTPEWQLEPDQGVNTNEHYVWANVTHLSQFGVFGTTPSGGQGPGGSNSLRTFGIISNITTEMPNVTAEEACTPSWTCTESSACINGTMTRTCTDSNNCGTTTGKPAEVTSCLTKDNQQKLAIAIGAIVVILVAGMLLQHHKKRY